MTRSKLVNNIAKKSGYARSTCDDVITLLAEEIKLCMMSGEKLVINGFAIFEISDRKERKARNPQTGKMEYFPAVRSVKCKMCRAIKDAINGK